MRAQDRFADAKAQTTRAAPAQRTCAERQAFQQPLGRTVSEHGSEAAALEASGIPGGDDATDVNRSSNAHCDEVCLVCAWRQMWGQEKIAEFSEVFQDLPEQEASNTEQHVDA